MTYNSDFSQIFCTNINFIKLYGLTFVNVFVRILQQSMARALAIVDQTKIIVAICILNSAQTMLTILS